MLPMATVWMRLRADMRARWRVMLGLALLLGLVGGVALTAAAGARRTDTAYPRLLAWANASQVTVIVTDRDPTGKPPAGQPQDKYFLAGGRAAARVRQRVLRRARRPARRGVRDALPPSTTWRCRCRAASRTPACRCSRARMTRSG